MVLAADSPQVLVTGDMNSVPIVDDDIVHEGAMVGIEVATGHGRPLVAGDIFLGHAIEKVNNTDGAEGAKNIRFRSGRYRLYCPIAESETFVITDVGAPIYASDDETLTKDIEEGSNSYVGRISRYISATKLEVEFETLQPIGTT